MNASAGCDVHVICLIRHDKGKKIMDVADHTGKVAVQTGKAIGMSFELCVSTI